MKCTARAIATDWRWPPESDLTAVRRFLNRGLSRPISCCVADNIAESSSEPNTRPQLASEEHVARRVEVVGQRELLVDRFDAQRSRIARVLDGDRLAIDENLPGIGRVRTRQRVNERRLAGAVATDEGHHLAGMQIDRDAVDGVNPAEGHADVTQLDERHTLRLRCGVVGGDRVCHVGCPPAHARPVWMTAAAMTSPIASAASATRFRPSRNVESMATAVTRTTPTTMSCDGESMLSSTMPERSDYVDDRAEDRTGDGADAAGERCPADHGGGDHVEFVLHTEVGDSGVEAGGLESHAGVPQHSHQDEREHHRPPDLIPPARRPRGCHRRRTRSDRSGVGAPGRVGDRESIAMIRITTG